MFAPSSKKQRLKNLKWSICVLDSFRIGMGVDIDKLWERISGLNDLYEPEDWRVLKRELAKIRELPLRYYSKTRFYVNFIELTKFLAKEFLLILVVISFIGMFTFRSYLPIEWLRIMAYMVIGFAWIVVFLRWYMKDKLMKVYSSHWDEYKRSRMKVKSFAQMLIDGLRLEVGKDPTLTKKCALKLYNKDYKGITIKKCPQLLRDFYVAHVVPLKKPRC